MMIAKIKATIDKYDLLGSNDALVIVAFSGGYDSSAMLHAMKQLGIKVEAAHVNHNLRKGEADEDERYVRSFCSSFDIPISVLSADVAGYAASEKISLETAGREIRYSYLSSLADEKGAKIATAHNESDSAESFMMHLLRGSGSDGLCGIKPKTTINGAEVIRPLINASREEILHYCCENGLNPRHDSSNDSDDYTRNFFRRHVMPPILDLGGGASIGRTADIIRTEQDFFEKYIATLLEGKLTLTEDGVSVESGWFSELHTAVKRRILRLMTAEISSETPSLLHIDNIIKMCEKNYGGKLIQLPGSCQAVLFGKKLTIQKRKGASLNA